MNRRTFFKISALTAGAVMGGRLWTEGVEAADAAKRVDAESLTDTEVRSIDIEVKFDTEIMSPPKSGQPVSIWMPLSHSCYEQDVTHMSVDAPAAFSINEDRRYGNRIVHVGPGRFREGDRIAVRYRIHRRAVHIIEEGDADIDKHLVLSAREKWNKDITRFTDEAAGDEKDPVRTGRKIYDALMEYLTYDTNTVGCGPGISTLTYENMTGRCADFHSLFRSMMIYRKIPVRWEQGILIPYPSENVLEGTLEGDCIGTHCWTEFHIGGGNWMPVDLVEGSQRPAMRDYFFGNLSPNRFNISTGRDLILSPPQEGEPLNTYPVTYGEFDGIPLIYGHHYRNNVSYKVLKMEV